MVFSSITFLFFFLPIVLCLYFAVGVRLKNLLLLAASLVFYAWGEGDMVWLLLFAALSNYVFGMLIEWSRQSSSRVRLDRWIVAAAVASNIGLLAFYKYANFFIANVNSALTDLHRQPIQWWSIALPIGISFFTFQALSYVIDVYRRDTPVQRNPLDLALYVALFPQLIAGPIVRYQDVAQQLKHHPVRFEQFVSGIKRFIFGMSKKVLIANYVGFIADRIFALPADGLHASIAWLGIVAYTLQIYFDFSGYSDMAIGLGRMFGFEFMENFRHPYISQSVSEFWRRWHISLSTWFRDYLYIPLGGNRVSRSRLYANLMIVFLIVGLWHGASWTFVAWGLYHGVFLIAERVGGNRLLDRAWRPLRHGYVMLAVMAGWVLFRSETFGFAAAFLQAMAGFGTAETARFPLGAYWSAQTALVLASGIVFSTPIYDWLSGAFERACEAARHGRRIKMLEGAWRSAGVAAYLGLMLLSVLELAAGSYNPFIYFRF